MANTNKFTEEEILEALNRSGYLFESEITKQLVDIGLFVESNISSLDPLTGKSREIDLRVEFSRDNGSKRQKDQTFAIARILFEIKNNNSPIVLLTKFENSPNSDIFTGLKVGMTIPSTLNEVYFDSFYEVLFGKTQKKLFTQFCSFSKKKSGEELMAHHPENIYSSLLKLTHFCEESAAEWNNDTNSKYYPIFRNILYLPVLLIKDDLYTLELNNDNKNLLTKVEKSYLVFNYHYKQFPQTSIIPIITEAGLVSFLNEINSAEKLVEKNMLKARKKVNVILKPSKK
ncbi:MAG: hypothetical protein IPP56_16710 [Bacteroidetes bacterium]|nr:hypothetical protein [Bacteroidota bacterium]